MAGKSGFVFKDRRNMDARLVPLSGFHGSLCEMDVDQFLLGNI